MTTPPGLLSACLIVRDEMAALPTCLASLRAVPAIAEICVLDTGSVDGTAEYAASTGARVEHWAWRDDFAAARNRAIDMAHTPWVLIIDADEVLHADSDALARALEWAQTDALVVDVDDVRAGRVVSRAPSARILRFSTACYRNRVHEVVSRRDGGALASALLPREVCRLAHTGYEVPERDARRHSRNCALADLELADRRSEGYPEAIVAALVNRGRAYSGAHGDSAAYGLEDFLTAWNLGAGGPFHNWAGELAVSGLAEAGRGAESAPIMKALALAGSDPAHLAWLTAKVLRSQGRPAEELVCLRRAEGRVTAMGERLSDEMVLAFRLNAELELQLLDDAVVTAARLAGGHARLDALRTFLALAGRLDAGDAASLLAEHTRAFARPALLDALRAGENDVSVFVTVLKGAAEHEYSGEPG